MSSPPGATVVDVHPPPTPPLRLRSSTFREEPSGTRFFQEWFGELENVGTVTQCFVLADVALRDPSGTTLATFRGIASGSPHDVGSSVSGACIAPSERVPIFGNAFADAQVPPGSIATVAIAFDPFELPTAVPHPHAPGFLVHVVQLSTGRYRIEGTLNGVGGPIHNIGIEAFSQGACGLVLDRVVDANLDTLEVGATLPIATTSSELEITQFKLYTDFIDGRAMLAAPARPSGSAADYRRARDELARRSAEHRAQR